MGKRILRSAALLAFVPTPVLADTVALKDTVPHITTMGHASKEVVPDQAVIRLGVRTEKPTAEAATEITAKTATDIIAAIKSKGIDAQDIKTTFDVSAQYDSQSDSKTNASHQIFRGYAADETIAIRVHDVSKAGSLAREFIDKGANDFKGIDYKYSKEKVLRRELDALAIRDALDSAKTYTDALGLSLGRVLIIGDEGADGVADLPSRRPPPGISHVVIPTEPGEQTIEEWVTVTWEIQGKLR